MFPMVPLDRAASCRWEVRWGDPAACQRQRPARWQGLRWRLQRDHVQRLHHRLRERAAVVRVPGPVSTVGVSWDANATAVAGGHHACHDVRRDHFGVCNEYQLCHGRVAEAPAKKCVKATSGKRLGVCSRRVRGSASCPTRSCTTPPSARARMASSGERGAAFARADSASARRPQRDHVQRFHQRV